jgi:hypothetical protein
VAGKDFLVDPAAKRILGGRQIPRDYLAFDILAVALPDAGEGLTVVVLARR